MESRSPNTAWDLTLLEQQPKMTMAINLALFVAATNTVVLVVAVVVVSRIYALQSLCWVLVLFPTTVFLTLWQSSLGLVVAMGLSLGWTC
jgi:hypothetical protein